MTLKELDDNIKDNPESMLAEKFRYIEKMMEEHWAQFNRDNSLKVLAHRMNIKLDETNE